MFTLARDHREKCQAKSRIQLDLKSVIEETVNKTLKTRQASESSLPNEDTNSICQENSSEKKRNGRISESSDYSNSDVGSHDDVSFWFEINCLKELGIRNFETIFNMLSKWLKNAHFYYCSCQMRYGVILFCGFFPPFKFNYQNFKEIWPFKCYLLPCELFATRLNEYVMPFYVSGPL